MRAEFRSLFRSPSVHIFDYKCREEPGSVSPPEPQPHSDICFTRTGSFECQIGKHQYEVENQVILLLNAGSELVVRHSRDVRDTCTEFRFKDSLLEEAQRVYYRKGEFASKRSCTFPLDVLSADPSLDYLHHQVLHSLERDPVSLAGLKVDVIAIELLRRVFRALYGGKGYSPHPAEERLREQHLEAIERAKSYMHSNFHQSLGLAEISRNAFVSEFHFSRL